MIIVLDTNLWVKELALNSDLGSALRFFLRRQKARLALPEVVRLEVQQNLRAILQENIDKVRHANRVLLALFRSMKECVLPSATDVENLIGDVFSGLGVDLIEVPFSFDSARASFMKTIKRLPPSDKTQQFKDGVLWADCLHLLDQDDVLLATQDKSFFASRDYAKGLAENLADEAHSRTNRLRITHSIGKLLESIRTEVCVNETWLIEAVKSQAHPRAEESLSRLGFEVEGNASMQRELFVTEDPDVLYFKYTLTLPCVDATDAGRTQGTLLLRGDGSFKPDPPNLLQAHADEEKFTFINPDGTGGSKTNYFLHAEMGVFGHRAVVHTVRYLLDDDGAG